jgi:hypothetical protein
MLQKCEAKHLYHCQKEKLKQAFKVFKRPLLNMKEIALMMKRAHFAHSLRRDAD